MWELEEFFKKEEKNGLTWAFWSYANPWTPKWTWLAWICFWFLFWRHLLAGSQTLCDAWHDGTTKNSNIEKIIRAFFVKWKLPLLPQHHLIKSICNSWFSNILYYLAVQLFSIIYWQFTFLRSSYISTRNSFLPFCKTVWFWSISKWCIMVWPNWHELRGCSQSLLGILVFIIWE